MKYVSDDQGYRALFDEENGFTIRIGYEGKDPFWKSNGPELLDISITNYCERECDFCYRESGENGSFMSLELYERILRDAHKIGVFQVALGGGNPNQHPEFITFLELTRKYGIIPSYTTNGQGMNAEIYEATKKFAGAVAVSWYAPYMDAKRVIDNCNTYGIPVNIHFVLDADNLEEAKNLLKDEYINRVNAIIFLAYKPVGKKKRKVLYKGKALYDFLEKVLAYDKCKIGFDSCMISHLSYHMDRIDSRSVDYCEAGRFSAFISETGEMYPCSFMCGAGAKGSSILNGGLEKVWETSDAFVNIRRKIMQRDAECNACNAFDVCHGGCPCFDINCKEREE